jgi:hypothetical protein
LIILIVRLYYASCQGRLTLFGRFAMSDSSAHLHMFLTIRRELVSYAAKNTGDRIQAEDIVQEAWIRFSSPKAETRPVVEQPVAYLYRIVRTSNGHAAARHDHTSSPPLWLLPTTVNVLELEILTMGGHGGHHRFGIVLCTF